MWDDRKKHKEPQLLPKKKPTAFLSWFCFEIEQQILKVLNLLYKPTKKIAIVPSSCSSILSNDSLPLLLPELGIINQKLHTVASKQTKSDASPLSIHCSWGTQSAIKFSVTKPETNSPQTQIATGWQHTTEKGKVYSFPLPFLLLTTTRDKILSYICTPSSSVIPSFFYVVM